MRPGLRTLLACVWLTAGLAACSASSPTTHPGPADTTTGSGGSTDTTAPAASADPHAEYATALAARLGPDGTIDLPLALALFDGAYGTRLTTEPAFPVVPESGTMAILAVRRHWAELSTTQQAAVNAVLDATASSTVDLSSAPHAGVALLARPQRTQSLNDLAQHAIAQIAAHWTSPTTFTPRLMIMAHDLPPTPSGGTVLADSFPLQADGEWSSTPSTYATCRIRVFPAILTPSADPIDVVATITHEIFHCFQFTVQDAAGTSIETTSEEWVTEGQAEWVGASLAGGGSVATSWWRTWMLHSTALSGRTYDAIGFYASLERRGIDPWTIFQPMIRGAFVGFEQAYTAATPGRGPDFLAEVAIDHAGLPNIGAPWQPLGPGAPTDITVALPLLINSGESHAFEGPIAAYDTTRFSADLADPVVTFTSDTAPWVIGSPGKAHTVPTAGAVTACITETCQCPDGQILDIPSLGDTTTVAAGVANATRDTITTHVTIQGVTLVTACRTIPRIPSTIPSCLVGTWRLTVQQFADDIAPGVTGAGLTGGTGGRTLTINADGTYRMTGDGSDPIRGHTVAGGLDTEIQVVISGTVNGQITSTPGHAVFKASDASIDLHAVETISGVPPVTFDHHYTDPTLFGNGDATVICTANSMSLAFTNVTFAYAK